MKFTLTLSVEIDLDGTTPEEIKDNLLYMVVNAMGNGLITGDTAATLDEWDSKVIIG